MSDPARHTSFASFYSFYLQEHRKKGTRVLHFVGTTGVLIILAVAIAAQQPRLIFAALFCGYFFAWVGHFFVEKNRPATFKYPFYSLAADFVLYFDLLRGKQKFG